MPRRPSSATKLCRTPEPRPRSPKIVPSVEDALGTRKLLPREINWPRREANSCPGTVHQLRQKEKLTHLKRKFKNIPSVYLLQ